MRYLLLSLLLFGAPAIAEPRQYGGVIYDLPSGWIKGRERDTHLTILSDLPNDRCEFCYIHLAPPVPFTGSLTDWLTANQGRFVDEDDREDILVIQPPEPTTINDAPAAFLAVYTGVEVFLLLAIQIGDTAALVGFEGNARDSDDLEETTGTFFNDVIPIIENMQFLAPGASGLLPEAVPGDLSGIFWGVAYRTTIQIDGTMGFEPRHTQIVFYEDGHFYDGTAPQGTAGLDRQALLATANTDFGTYERRRRNLTLTYSDGTVDEYRWDGDGWVDGDLTLIPVAPLADGSTISGRLTDFNYTGFVEGTGLSGGAASASSTTFYPDGTYTGSRVGTVSSTVVTTTSRRDTGGTYAIADGLVIMTPGNGDPATQSLIFRVGDSILVGDQFLDQD